MTAFVYADYNATTPLGAGALNGMDKAREIWGNPSSAHRLGRLANELMESARRSVATVAEALPKEIVFTSGGSEANGLALMGSFFQNPKDFRVISSRVEHSSVRDTLQQLQSLGAKVENVKTLANGQLDLGHFARLNDEFRPHLVSLMTANNETGVLFPIPEIAPLCGKSGAVLHTDAVQAFGKVSPDRWKGADLISISAHKIHGPKGVGALIIRNGKQLRPTHFGGSQEIKRRGGTENLMGIAGFGGACEDLLGAAGPYDGVAGVRDLFETQVLRGLDQVSVSGGESDRLPNTSNLRFHGIPSEILLGALDLEGVCVSAGSACSSGSISPSHVLIEMGMTPDEARQCVRFSWGRPSTNEEATRVADSVLSHVRRIRARRQKGKN